MQITVSLNIWGPIANFSLPVFLTGQCPKLQQCFDYIERARAAHNERSFQSSSPTVPIDFHHLPPAIGQHKSFNPPDKSSQLSNRRHLPGLPFAMGLFSSSSSSNNTCPSITTGPQYGTKLSATPTSHYTESILTATTSGADTVVGSLTFHRFTIILCGAFTAATFFSSGVQIVRHATHFSNPSQQTQYVLLPANSGQTSI